MKTKLLTLIVIASLLLSVPVFAQDDAEGKLNVVATTTQASDLARIIGGDLIEVTGLMGAGVDPHLYQPTESDIEAMNKADLVIYNGLHLEGQFDTVFEGLGERDVRTYAVTEPVDLAGFVLESVDPEKESGAPDPHAWFDPRNWQLVAEGLAEVLGEMDPENAEAYAENAEAYVEELGVLYDWALEAMSLVPEENRVLITSHDAFQYFGDAFGWEVRGLQGISTEDEAGVADVQELVDFVVEREVPVLFVESSVPPDAIEAVQEGARAQDHEVGVGLRELYSDAMGAPETFGGTYVGMVSENVITILQSMGYADDIPEWPAEEIGIELPEGLMEMTDILEDTEATEAED